MMGASKLFGLLADNLRRRVLLLLRDAEPLAVPEEVLAAGDGPGPTSPEDGPPGRGSGPESDCSVAVRLYHVHLPKLEAASVVEWDRDRALVSRGPRFEEVRPMLDLLAANAAAIPQDLFAVDSADPAGSQSM